MREGREKERENEREERNGMKVHLRWESLYIYIEICVGNETSKVPLLS